MQYIKISYITVVANISTLCLGHSDSSECNAKLNVFSPGVGHCSPQSSHGFVVFIFSTQLNLKDAI